MRTRIGVFPALLLLLVASSGCAAGLKQTLTDQQARLEAMQASLDEMAGQNEAVGQEVEAIGRDVAQIGQKVTQNEEQIAELDRKTENVSTRLSLLTDEVSRLKRTAEAQIQPAALQFTEGPPPAPPTTGQPAAAGDYRSAYDHALQLYNPPSNQPREAIAGFARVIQMAPSSDLADNAEYWTGECYYKLEEFPQALEAFRRVLNYAGSNKLEDAFLKIGMTLQLMGRRDEAAATYRDFLQNYPNSTHVALVRRKLAEIGG